MIEIETSSIQDAIKAIRKQYSNISGPTLNQAISRALNRAAQQSRTAANKEIRKTYNISASAINNDLKTRNSNARNLTAMILASGSPISLSNFGATQTKGQDTVKFDKKGNLSRVTRKTRKRNPVSGVSFEVKKGNKEILPTAFIQTANGGSTVFARGSYKGSGEGFEFAKSRLPIAKLSTISLPLMFANNEVINPTGKQAEASLNDRITHEITWLLQR